MPRMSYEVLANRRLRRLIARPPAVHVFRFASNFGYIWVFKTWSLLHCMSLCCLCRCVLQWHSIREQRGTHKEKARKKGGKAGKTCWKKNGVLSYMDLQKDEECHLFLRSYFIFDVATKRIPLKGCFYVPDVLLPGNLHLRNTVVLLPLDYWPSCNKPFFPWEK